MTATNHVVTGAVIMTFIPHVGVGLAVALLSHLVLDVIPHFGFGKQNGLPLKKFVPVLLTDMIVAATVLLVLLIAQPADFIWLMAGGIIASSPDLLSIPYFIDSLKHRPHQFGAVQRFLGKIQWSETPRGLIVEALWLAGMGSLLAARAF